MIQSLSTEILVRDEQVISGLQKDIEKIFNVFLKGDKGESSNIEKGLIWWTDTNVSVDVLIQFLGKSAKNVEFFNDQIIVFHALSHFTQACFILLKSICMLVCCVYPHKTTVPCNIGHKLKIASDHFQENNAQLEPVFHTIDFYP